MPYICGYERKKRFVATGSGSLLAGGRLSRGGATTGAGPPGEKRSDAERKSYAEGDRAATESCTCAAWPYASCCCFCCCCWSGSSRPWPRLDDDDDDDEDGGAFSGSVDGISGWRQRWHDTETDMTASTLQTVCTAGLYGRP